MAAVTVALSASRAESRTQVRRRLPPSLSGTCGPGTERPDTSASPRLTYHERSAADQGRDVLGAELARRALGEVLAEGVVEAVQRCVGGLLCAGNVLGVSAVDQPPCCG